MLGMTLFVPGNQCLPSSSMDLRDDAAEAEAGGYILRCDGSPLLTFSDRFREFLQFTYFG